MDSIWQNIITIALQCATINYNPTSDTRMSRLSSLLLSSLSVCECKSVQWGWWKKNSIIVQKIKHKTNEQSITHHHGYIRSSRLADSSTQLVSIRHTSFSTRRCHHNVIAIIVHVLTVVNFQTKLHHTCRHVSNCRRMTMQLLLVTVTGRAPRAASRPEAESRY